MAFIKQLNDSNDNILTFKVTGKLGKKDYDIFVPEVQQFIKKHGKIYILFEMEDFKGWDIAALWENTKFETKFFDDIDRVAVVGEKQWQDWMKKFTSPFGIAKTRFFKPGETERARRWLAGENVD